MLTVKPVYFLMFVSGLLGGFGHCLAMCGPLVMSYSVTVKNKSLLPHVFYNLGRISTYALLGGIAGMTGSFVSIAGYIYGLQRVVMILAGGVIILMGIGLAGWLPFAGYFKDRAILFSPFISRVKNLSSENMTKFSYYPIGVFLGFVPCGLLYTALITTARAGMEARNHFEGFFEGILIMTLFGIGTMPPLLLFGKVIGLISLKMRTGLYRVAAVVMIITGVVFIARMI
ncbi:MAG: sulfite exporter TauE/SafE family protein [Nitrospirae bacterium]|nr:sulfite exporter TauE/SafE family protein [Nitrospirota bacterium]